MYKMFTQHVQNVHQNLLKSDSIFDQIKAVLAWEAEGVIDIAEEAVFVVVKKEFLPHTLLITDKADNHLELAEVGLEIIHTPLEHASTVLVGAGDVRE